MNMEEHDFLKKALQEAAESDAQNTEVDDLLWQSIEQRIQPKKKRRRFFFILPCLGWVGILGAVSFGALWMLLKPTSQEQAVIVSHPASMQQSVEQSSVLQSGATSSTMAADKSAQVIGSATNLTSKPVVNYQLAMNKGSKQQASESRAQKALDKAAGAENLPAIRTEEAEFTPTAPVDATLIAEPVSPPQAPNLVAKNPVFVSFLPLQLQQVARNTADQVQIPTEDFISIHPSVTPSPKKYVKTTYYFGLYGGSNTLRMRPFTDDLFIVNEFDSRKNNSSFNFSATGGMQQRWNRYLGYRIYGTLGFSKQRYQYDLKQLKDPTINTSLIDDNQILVEITYRDTILTEQRQFISTELGGDLLLYPFTSDRYHLYGGAALRYNGGGSERLLPIWRTGTALRLGQRWEVHGGMSFQPYAAPWSYFATQTVQWEFGFRHFIR
jgi:hypothetical protein